MATTRSKPARAKTAGTKSTRPNRAAPERDSSGRFKPDHHVRNAAVGATVLIGAAAAGFAAAFKFGLLDRFLPAGEGHSAEDLLIDNHPGPDHRAPAAFRPDMDAPMTKAERKALSPARAGSAIGGA